MASLEPLDCSLLFSASSELISSLVSWILVLSIFCASTIVVHISLTLSYLEGLSPAACIHNYSATSS